MSNANIDQQIISYKIINNKFQVDACLHIIDQGSVLYLIVKQILLYNQQYAYNDGNNDTHGVNNESSAIISAISSAAVTTIYVLTLYESSSDVSANINAVTLDIFDVLSSTNIDAEQSAIVSSAVDDAISSTTTTMKMISYKSSSDEASAAIVGAESSTSNGTISFSVDISPSAAATRMKMIPYVSNSDETTTVTMKTYHTMLLYV